MDLGIIWELMDIIRRNKHMKRNNKTRMSKSRSYRGVEVTSIGGEPVQVITNLNSSRD